MESLKFIRTNGLDKLIEKYNIKKREHKLFPELVSLSYSKQEQDFSNQIIKECRGLVINQDTLEVISQPLKKSLNYGAPGCTDIPFEDAEFYDKEDGTMINLYYYGNSWQTGTTGTPDGLCSVNYPPLNNPHLTFSELFFDTIEFDLNNLDKNKTYIFELCSPYNKVVVKREDQKPYVRLLAVRDRTSLKEEKISIHSYLPLVKKREFKSYLEVLDYCKDLDGDKEEGFIILNTKTFERIKIKGEDYVTKHYLLDSFSNKAIFKLVKNNDNPDDLMQFKVLYQKYNIIKEKVNELKLIVDKEYKRFEYIEDQKQFALAVSTNPLKSLLFQKRNNIVWKFTLKKMLIKTLENYLINILKFNYKEL